MSNSKDTRQKSPNVPTLRFKEFASPWIRTCIGDSFECLDSRRVPLNESQRSGMAGNIPYYGANSVQDYINQFLFDEDLILLAEDGGHFDDFNVYPIAQLIHGKSWVNNHAHVLKPIRGDISFLFHQLVHKDIRKYINGTSRAKLNQEDLLQIPIVFTSDEEQLKIGCFLSLIDQKIAVQNKIIEALVEQMNAIRDRIFSNVKGETVPLSKVISYEQPTPYIVKSDEYSSDASLTPVLTANKTFILGYTNEAEGIYRKGDVIIFDDFTLGLKYADFPFKVKSSAIKILSCRDKRVVRYAFEYLSFLGLSSSEHKRHYISEVAGKKIIVPEIRTVETISSLFNSLEKRIRNETKIKELMERQKEFFLNTMFI